MGYSLGNNTGQIQYDNNTTSGAVAFSGGVTAGSLLVISIGSYDSTNVPATVSDSQGNTYTKNKSATALGDGNWASIYSAIAGSSGANSVTIATHSGGYVTAWGQEFIGNAASPTDQSNSNTSASAAAATPGSVTPTEDNELVVTVANTSGTTTYTTPTGYSDLLKQGNNTIHSSVYAGYKIQTTATATNPSTGLSPSCAFADLVVTYKAASGPTVTTSILPSGVGSMGSGQTRAILPSGLGYMG